MLYGTLCSKHAKRQSHKSAALPIVEQLEGFLVLCESGQLVLESEHHSLTANI